MNKIKVLSLDQATKKTGYAVFKHETYLTSGLIDVDSKKLSSEDRFEKMCKAICELIDYVSPDILVMEDVAFQNNAAALISLARLQGVIIAKCLDSKTEFYIFSPSSWRKNLCFQQGRGVKRDDLKAQAIKYVKEHFGIDAEEDICEAICIGASFVSTNLNKKKTKTNSKKGAK